jgi:hypothetical protein
VLVVIRGTVIALCERPFCERYYLPLVLRENTIERYASECS